MIRTTIRVTLLAALLLPVLGLIATPASAQQRVIYPYCLQDTRAGTITCSFRSLRECLDGRNSTNDTCIPNPDWYDRRH
jgi:hypothetical protein